MSSPKPSVAILGRGIAGLSLAYYLIRAGFRPVVYGQREGSASRAAQGVLCNKGLHFYESPLFAAKLESLRSMPPFLDRIEAESGHPIPRFFRGVEEPYWSPEDFQAMTSRVYRNRFWGTHGTQHIREVSPLPESQNRPLGALLYPADGWYEVRALLDALELLIVRDGAEMRDEVIQTIQKSPEGTVLLTSVSGAAQAFDQLVLATGAGLGDLWPQLGVGELKMFWIGGQTLEFSRLDDGIQRVLVKGTQSLTIVGNRAILGSSSWKGFEAPSLAADTAELLANTERAMGTHFTGQAITRQGVRLRFKDRMPLVGPLSVGPFAGQVQLLTGFYKNGMQIAELCARDLSFDIFNTPHLRRYPEFSPLRFSV